MSAVRRGVKLSCITEEDADGIASFLSDPTVAGSSVDLRDARLKEAGHWRKIAQSKMATATFIIRSPDDEIVGLAPIYNVSIKEKTAFAGVTILDTGSRGSGLGYTAKLLQMKMAFEGMKLTCLFEDLSAEEASLISYYESKGYENLGPNEKGGFRLRVSSETWRNSLANELG